MDKNGCNVAKDEKRITRIFGITARKRLHIIRNGRSPYCRGTAQIITLRHLTNVPASSICKHCVTEYLKDEGFAL